MSGEFVQGAVGCLDKDRRVAPDELSFLFPIVQTSIAYNGDFSNALGGVGLALAGSAGCLAILGHACNLTEALGFVL